MKIFILFIFIFTLSSSHASESYNSRYYNTLLGTSEDAMIGECGPDITSWFLKDIKAHLKLSMDWKEKSFGPMESLRFRNHAGLLMSQKWMNFNKVSKGVCTHTVSIAGYCLDRRVLGSFLFGLISYKTPPQPFNAKGAISLGWKKFKFYNRDQPHFSQHENFNKIPKFFTYAASQLGYSFGEKNTNILSMNGKKFKARFKNSIENLKNTLKIEKIKLNPDTLFHLSVGEGYSTKQCHVSKSKYTSDISSLEWTLQKYSRVYGERFNSPIEFVNSTNVSLNYSDFIEILAIDYEKY